MLRLFYTLAIVLGALKEEFFQTKKAFTDRFGVCSIRLFSQFFFKFLFVLGALKEEFFQTKKALQIVFGMFSQFVTGSAKTLHVSMQILTCLKSHNFLMVACNSTELCTVFAKWTINITCEAYED